MKFWNSTRRDAFLGGWARAKMEHWFIHINTCTAQYIAHKYPATFAIHVKCRLKIWFIRRNEFQSFSDIYALSDVNEIPFHCTQMLKYSYVTEMNQYKLHVYIPIKSNEKRELKKKTKGKRKRNQHSKQTKTNFNLDFFQNLLIFNRFLFAFVSVSCTTEEKRNGTLAIKLEKWCAMQCLKIDIWWINSSREHFVGMPLLFNCVVVQRRIAYNPVFCFFSIFDWLSRRDSGIREFFFWLTSSRAHLFNILATQIPNFLRKRPKWVHGFNAIKKQCNLKKSKCDFHAYTHTKFICLICGVSTNDMQCAADESWTAAWNGYKIATVLKAL